MKPSLSGTWRKGLGIAGREERKANTQKWVQR